MITLILTIHLSLAACYAITTGVLLVGAMLQKGMPAVLVTVFGSFSGIIVSGIGLVAVSPKAMAQFCVSALVSSVIGAAIVVLYRRRIATVQAV